MEQKRIYTRLLFFGILISFFTVSCGGDVDYRQHDYLRYINKSDYPIKIKTYKRIYEDHVSVHSYDIAPKDSLEQDHALMFGSSNGIIRVSDSVRIIFNNKKQLLYVPIKLGKHSVFDFREDGGSYEIKPVGERNTRYRYVFTNEDYDRAENCDGSCE